MPLVWREDWLEFSADKELASGSSNLWATDNADYGYKIFHNKQHARTHEELADAGYECYEEGFFEHEIINPSELERMFLLYELLHRRDVGPKPLEIFTYKTLMGIKLERAEQPNTFDLYEQRATMDKFKCFTTMFGEGYANWLMTTTGPHNWGVREGSLIYIGVNVGALGRVNREYFRQVTGNWEFSGKDSYWNLNKVQKTIYLLPDSEGKIRWSNPINGDVTNVESFMCREVDEATFMEENGEVIGRRKFAPDDRYTYWTYTPPQPIPALTEIILDNFESK